MYRSLIHFWRMNLAVVAGVAVTTAVLTGALMVGDSLRGSLQDLTLDRLGQIDQALLNQRFFPAELGSRLAASEVESWILAPTLHLRGSAVHADSDRRASGVQILGIDESFLSLYPEVSGAARWSLDRAPGQSFPSVVLNESLARELGASVGDDVLLSFGSHSEIPSASLMGRRDETDLLTTLRVTVKELIPSSGPGRFGLEARQTRALNAFVDLSTLQRRLDKRGQVNLLLVGRDAAHPGQDIALEPALRAGLSIEDLGLQIRVEDGFVGIESRELILRDGVVDAISRSAESAGATAWPYLTYLANRLEIDGKTVPYSTVTAIPADLPAALGALAVREGAPVADLGTDQIALNAWAAEELAASLGDTVELTYFEIGPDDLLVTRSAAFRIGAVVEMSSLAIDSTLTPEVPGVSDSADMAGWDPPFPVDLDLVRPQDEAYWDQFRGTPKAFVPLTAGQRLWQSRHGRLTGIRLVPGPAADPEALAAEIESQLPAQISLESAGFRLLPLRSQGLESASGTTDFAGLFVGFSLFLIVSAALLVALLFSLLVEQRAPEAGLLLATGHRVRDVRRQFLLEGAVLAGSGILIGSALASGYTTLVLKGLSAWWSPVLDSPLLRTHVLPSTLIVGGLGTLILVMLVIVRSVRRLTRIPARRLLAGRLASTTVPGGGRKAAITATAALLLATGTTIASLISGMESAPTLFFIVGASLLVLGIASFTIWAQRTHEHQALRPGFLLPTLAARNSSRHLGRSLLSISLVASASFVLVSVSASRKTHDRAALSRSSGTGGFTLVAEADTPLPRGLAAISETPDHTIYDLRLLPGDDASCLNLYQPEKPRVLGVPPELVERGGFSFRGTLSAVDNPWSLLEEPLSDGAIPAIGDYNSVRWILHSGLGQDVEFESDNGEPLRLRIVGLLATSIFQSELLISEEMFLRHFPDHPGFGFFLGETAPDRFDSLATDLESRFSAYGLDTASAAQRLAEFQAVENMYLTTFEVLGGLGLLLGTLGLAVVLLRNTLERRGELAILRSFGYRRSTLGWMVVAENAFLLGIGLAIGSASGLIAVAPYLVTGGIEVPWASLAGILAAVFAVGLLASIAAVAGSVRVPLLPALKAE